MLSPLTLSHTEHTLGQAQGARQALTREPVSRFGRIDLTSAGRLIAPIAKFADLKVE